MQLTKYIARTSSRKRHHRGFWAVLRTWNIAELPAAGARFEGRVRFEADIWMLGCVLFEIRTGFSLFVSFMGSEIEVLKQTVETLGRLPDLLSCF